LQYCLLQLIIFGCNIVYCTKPYLVAIKFIAMIVLDVILFIATTYFGLQYVLLPRTMRVAIEAITSQSIVATIEYIRGKT
jgi:hypothetical protein